MENGTKENSNKPLTRKRLNLKELEAAAEKVILYQEEKAKRLKEEKKESLQSREFLRGPIPISWIQKAASISPICGYLSIILWHLYKLRPNHVRMTAVVCKKYGLYQRTVRRHLHALQQVGLVSLEPNGREAVKVTVLTTISEAPKTVQ